MHMSRAKGNIAEEKAVSILESLGFTIKSRNFYSRFGELDIITQKDGVTHFIEVKSSISYEPLENITPIKIRRLLKTIDYYILKNSITSAWQLDAFVFRGQEYEIIENITLF